ncbi:GNAT family N-acetyltransferase [Flavisolibacter tropicus]|uniref:GNAT family N-acetyltransferase n=1 Tax=Flavisolibacter tropicus TaxID=1492898 RepID=UPI000833C3AD|nr:GNAT family protein [Flavisolibacter tropicus]
MHLRRFKAADFALLAQWVTSPSVLFQFAGTDFSFPLTPEQIGQYQTTHPDCLFFIACLFDNEPFAFGEIIPQANNTPRLGRLLVGDTKNRSKGLGTMFVQLMVDECKRLFHCHQVELYVLSDNIPAQRCYEKVGFYRLPDANILLVVGNKTHPIHKMRLDIR